VSQSDAEKVLQDVVALYASMNSYMDSGYVTTTFVETGRLRRISFSTLYQKPSLFRFAFSTPHPHPPLNYIVTQHVVGFDGIEGYSLTKKYDSSQALKSINSLELVVAGATGISSGSAHTIGRLLLPEVGGLSILELVSPQLEDEMDIDGITCYSIAARHPQGGEWELWIEKEALLLRKVIRADGLARNEEVRERNPDE
jgi:hypothetical protein